MTSTVFPATGSIGREPDVSYPKPPSLHWALVLLLHMLTFGLFTIVWTFRQALWVRRIDRGSNALFLLIAAFALGLTAQVVEPAPEMWLVSWVALLAGLVAFSWAHLSMRQTIEAHFDVDLSGILTLLLSVYYLQYHMRRIARGEHEPRRHRFLQ